MKNLCNFIQFSRKKVREKKFFARTHKPQNLNSSYSNECLNKKKGHDKEIPKIICGWAVCYNRLAMKKNCEWD